MIIILMRLQKGFGQWSHVKSKTNPTRIPEALRLGEVYRSEPSEQANINYLMDISLCNS